MRTINQLGRSAPGGGEHLLPAEVAADGIDSSLVTLCEFGFGSDFDFDSDDSGLGAPLCLPRFFLSAELS